MVLRKNDVDFKREIGKIVYVRKYLFHANDPRFFETPPAKGPNEDYLNSLLEPALSCFPNMTPLLEGRLNDALFCIIGDAHERMNSGSPDWPIKLSLWQGHEGIVYRVQSQRKGHNKRRIEEFAAREEPNPQVPYDSLLKTLAAQFEHSPIEFSLHGPATTMIKIDRAIVAACSPADYSEA